MTEERKSIWRRPWKGWSGLVGWLIILFAAVLFALTALNLATERPRTPMGEILFRSLITALLAVILVAAVVWFIRWLCSWRNFRRFLFGLVCFATLVALFYAEENIRGRLAWNVYVREVESQGETLDLAKLNPPSVPNDQNLTLCPLFRPVYDFTWNNPLDLADIHGGSIKWHDTNGMARLYDFNIYSPVEKYISSLPAGELHTDLAEKASAIKANLPLSNGWINLRGFEDYLLLGTSLNEASLTSSVASNVLLGLHPFDADFEKLRQCADQRPLDRWAIHYDTNYPYAVLLPHLPIVKQLCELLQVSASAKLATGNAASALEDINLAFRFAESVRDEPFVISQIIRTVCHKLNTQPLKEGLARHQFNNEQLKELEEKYRTAGILSGAVLSIQDERCSAIVMIKIFRKYPSLLNALDSSFLHNAISKRPIIAASLLIAPKGWILQSQVATGRLLDQHILKAIDEQSHRIDVPLVDALQTTAERLGFPFGLYARALVPGVGKALVRIIEGQTLVDQAVIACALERYHLVHGSYPEKLELLSPQFLETVPQDVITGEPMIYRLLPDDRYILYSVGWDGNDDGGTPVEGKRYNPDNHEDWVWELPDPKLQPY